MQFPFTTPPVKMRLERSAERDKREIINILSADDAQSEAERILNRFVSSEQPILPASAKNCIFCKFVLDNRPTFRYNRARSRGKMPHELERSWPGSSVG